MKKRTKGERILDLIDQGVPIGRIVKTLNTSEHYVYNTFVEGGAY